MVQLARCLPLHICADSLAKPKVDNSSHEMMVDTSGERSTEEGAHAFDDIEG